MPASDKPTSGLLAHPSDFWATSRHAYRIQQAFALVERAVTRLLLGFSPGH